MAKNRIIALVCLVINGLSLLDCIGDFAKTGIEGFVIGDFELRIKFVVLFATSLGVWISCRDATIKSPLCVSKIASFFSVFCSGFLLFLDLIIQFSVCEVSKNFKIVFSGELDFLNGFFEAHLSLLSVGVCTAIYLSGIVFQCLADIVQTLSKKSSA